MLNKLVAALNRALRLSSHFIIEIKAGTAGLAFVPILPRMLAAFPRTSPGKAGFGSRLRNRGGNLAHNFRYCFSYDPFCCSNAFMRKGMAFESTSGNRIEKPPRTGRLVCGVRVGY